MTRNSGSSSTTSVPADDSNVEAERPDDEMIEELLQGLPEEQQAVKMDRVAGDDPAAPQPPGFREPPPGKVILLNLKYQNETFFVPEADEDNVLRFVGQRRLEFVDGYCICTREQADFIKSLAPHVYEEPGPDSGLSILEFRQTGFKTRVPEAMNDYAVMWAENQ